MKYKKEKQGTYCLLSIHGLEAMKMNMREQVCQWVSSPSEMPAKPRKKWNGERGQPEHTRAYSKPSGWISGLRERRYFKQLPRQKAGMGARVKRTHFGVAFHARKMQVLPVICSAYRMPAARVVCVRAYQKIAGESS